MTVSLSIPLAIRRYLYVDHHELSIFIIPNDNTDCVIYENTTNQFLDANVTDRQYFDGSRLVHHKVRTKRKQTEPSDDCEEEYEFAGAPFKKIALERDVEKMSREAFHNYFMKHRLHSEGNDIKLVPSQEVITRDLRVLYTTLLPFEINDKVLDVVLAALQMMYSKTLVNTMKRTCDKRNKKFKAQLKYLLQSLCDQLERID